MKKLAVSFVLACVLVLSLASGAFAKPHTPNRPNLPPCQTGNLGSGYVSYEYDDDFEVVSYVQKLTDNSGNYCGYMQPVTYVYAVRAWPFGNEPMTYASVQLYQQDGVWLDGYTWSGLGWAGAGGPAWWFYGPHVWVTCGSPVHARGTWLESATASETDYGQSVTPDGSSVISTTADRNPC